MNGNRGQRPPPPRDAVGRPASRDALSTDDLEDYAGREPERTVMVAVPGPPEASQRPPPATASAGRRVTGEQRAVAGSTPRKSTEQPVPRRVTAERTAPVPALDAPTAGERPLATPRRITGEVTAPLPALPATKAGERPAVGRRVTAEITAPLPAAPPPTRTGERPAVGRRVTAEITAPLPAVRAAPPDPTDEMTDQLRLAAGPTAGSAAANRVPHAKAMPSLMDEDPPAWSDDVNDAPTGVHAVPQPPGESAGERAADPNDAPTGVRPFPSAPRAADAPIDVNEMPTGVRAAPVGPPPAPSPDPTAGLAEAAETTSPAGGPRAGAWSRRHSRPSVAAAQPMALVQPVEAPAPADPEVRRRLVIVGSIAAGLVLALIGWAFFFRPPDQPTLEELQVLYPYGFEGAVGPRGERAPGATQVAMKFQKRVACTRHSDDLDCLIYEYSAGQFTGTMVVRKVGRFWIRPSDEGMPFRPQR